MGKSPLLGVLSRVWNDYLTHKAKHHVKGIEKLEAEFKAVREAVIAENIARRGPRTDPGEVIRKALQKCLSGLSVIRV